MHHSAPTQALDKFTIEKDVAAYIKKEFDSKHNPTWHCIVGRNFGALPTGQPTGVGTSFWPFRQSDTRSSRDSLSTGLPIFAVQDPMLPTRPSTSFTSTWALWLCCSSRADELAWGCFAPLLKTHPHWPKVSPWK